jgi:hypothetical protein
MAEEQPVSSPRPWPVPLLALFPPVDEGFVHSDITRLADLRYAFDELATRQAEVRAHQ